MTVTSLPHYAAARNGQTYEPFSKNPEDLAAAAERSEELNNACRELIAMTHTPAQLHTGTGTALIQKLRNLFSADDNPTDDELIGMAVMRVGYLER
jgi:hypothetical protein